MTRALTLFLLLSWLVFAGPTAEVFAQSRTPTLSPEQKKLLSQRLDSFVDYQKSQQWAKQYDLLSSLTKRALTRKDYVEMTSKAHNQWGRAPIVDFVPLGLAFLRPDSQQKLWMINGCALTSQKGQRTGKLYVIEAYWERNNWFFSEFHEFLGDAGRNACPIDAPKSELFS